MRRSARLSAAAAVVLLLSACRTAAAPKAAAPQPAAAAVPASRTPAAAAATRVSLRLPFLIAGYDAPLVLAKARGYDSRQGLDVTIGQGRGSVTSAETVANGTDTFGFVDAGAAAGLISKGVPIKVIAVFVQKTPQGFIHGPAVPVADAAGLRGRTLIGVAGSSNVQLLPAVLTKLGLTLNDVKVDVVSPEAETTTLNAHRDWVLLSNINNTYIDVQTLWPQVQFTSYADFGVDPYSFSLVTSLAEIRNHPGTVRRFVAASVQGWQAAVRDPQAAVAATAQAYPQAKPALMAKELQTTLGLIHTPATRGKPLGWSAASDWQSTLTLLQRYAGVAKVKPLADYYTNSFLPSAPAAG